MNKIIADLPINTLEEIFSADEHKFPEEVKAVLRWEGVEAYFRSQSEEDALTRALYGDADKDGRVRFPAATDNVTLECIDRIGTQSSRYHGETVEEHIQLVFLYIHRISADRNFLLMALLHDCGKKWTAGTNKRGEICFYGHDKLSALFANSYLKQMGVSDEDREWIVTGIYYHMRPKKWERMENAAREKIRHKFIQKHGEKLYWMLIAFAECDRGVARVDALTKAMFRMGKEEALRLHV